MRRLGGQTKTGLLRDGPVILVLRFLDICSERSRLDLGPKRSDASPLKKGGAPSASPLKKGGASGHLGLLRAFSPVPLRAFDVSRWRAGRLPPFRPDWSARAGWPATPYPRRPSLPRPSLSPADSASAARAGGQHTASNASTSEERSL